MKKVFGFGGKKGLPSSSGNKRVEFTSQCGYHIQEKDLGRIHRAATMGNVGKVRQILFLGINGVNDTDKMNRTALHLACANGHAEVVTLLAKRKCQLNLVDSENKTALIKAVQCQEEECATILLDRGADPNITDDDGNTALHLAVLGQNTAIVAKLLAQNANMKVRNKDGLTPLLLAVNEKKEHAVKVLVKKAAEVNPFERPALHSACASGCIEEVNILAHSKILLNLVDNEDRTALIKAVQYQEEECATILLDRGADPNITDVDGNTALHLAVLGQNTAIVAKLLAQNANMKVRNKDGLTPLLLAVNEKKEHAVKVLVKKAAEVNPFERPALHSACASGCIEEVNILAHSKILLNLVDNEDRTALIKAVQYQEEECATILLDRGADPNITDVDGNTALHLAVLGQNTTIVAKLLAQNANMKVRNKDGLTPLLLAVSEKKEHAVEVLVKKAAEVNPFEWPALHLACANGCIEEVNILAHSKILLNLVDNEKRTALIKAVQYQEEECATILLDRGADPNITDVDGNTALHLAVLGQNTAIVAKLLAQNANMKVRNKDGLTPLLLAVSEKKEHAVKVLVKKAAEVNPYERPALHLACANGCIEEVNILARSKILLNLVDNEKRTALIKAVQCQEEECATILLDHGADPNIMDIDGNTALHHAVLGQNTAIITKLLAQNANMKVRNKNGFTPHTLALSDKTEEMVAFLVKERVRIKQSESNHQQTSVYKAEGRSESLSESSKSLVVDKKSEEDSLSSLSSKPNIDDSWPTSEDEDFDFDTKKAMNPHLAKLLAGFPRFPKTEETTKPATEKKGNDKMSALGEDEDTDSPWDSESVSASVPQNYVVYLPEAADQRGKNILNGQVEDSHEKVSSSKAKVDVKDPLPKKAVRTTSVQTSRSDSPETCILLKRAVEVKAPVPKRSVRENSVQTSRSAKLDLEVASGEEEEGLDGSENSHPQVSHSYEKGESLLHEKHVLQTEIAKLRLEIDTTKNQNQQMEEKYFEDIIIVKENNDLLQKTIKVNEKAFQKTISQYNARLNVLTAENTILKSKLETEKKDKERLETEIESYRSRLATAVQDHEQSETSKRDLQRDFQRARDEWFRLRDKMNCDMSDLKGRNEILSQRLSEAESKFNNLEIEFHHMRDALRETTLVLEGVQRDLSETQCQKKETEHMYQKEQNKVNKCIEKQGSLEKRLSQLQSENELLRQRLNDAHSEVYRREKTVFDFKDQLQDIMKMFQTRSEKHAVMLNEKYMELINICNRLKEGMHECENSKAEKDATVRPLQQELADTLKNQSMSEASLQTTSHSHMNLEDEALDIKKKLDQSRSQNDDLTAKLTTVFSKCLNLDEKNKCLQCMLVSSNPLQKKYEKLKNKNRNLKQEVVNLKRHTPVNTTEVSEGAQCYWKAEERARRDIEAKSEVSRFSQRQAASQENLEMLKEIHYALVIRQLEFKSNHLESELSKIKTSHDSKETDLEKYRQLYLKEIESKQALRNELNKTKDRLAEVNTELLKKWQNKSSLSTFNPKPDLDTPYDGNFDNFSLNRNPTQRDKLMTSVSKMQQKFEKNSN